MRRKIATLEVWEDTSIRSSKNAIEVREPSGVPTGKWTITINPDETMPNGHKINKLTALAHEMGHFLGQLFRTPAALADMEAARVTQHNFGDQFLQSILFGKEKYKAEKEAWQIARLIHPGLNEASAAEALATYSRWCDTK